MESFDLIVVGSGHAGVEASLASARMGCRTLCLTMNLDQIGTMSCNPAIGGLGKSQIAKEVDLLGGAMARIADKTAFQYRLLNERKGAAVQATRVHVDRHEYRAEMKHLLECEPNLSLKQGQVEKLIIEAGEIRGVLTKIGQKFQAKAVVITTGTFMNGVAHVGKQSYKSGRAGEPASVGLSDFLRSEGFKLSRFKTGTVPRVDARSIDFSRLEPQPSQDSIEPLSFFTENMRPDLEPAHLAFTNSRTHEIIQQNIEQSPLYAGIIQSTGPRYCPSVEDKITRFAGKSRHQIFVEREGRKTNEVYVGGVSTSLPYEVQIQFLRSVEGFERAEIMRPGYAIEYDFIDSTQLFPTLETKAVQGLYFAGQVNGSSGYEEAAVQGLLAGVNAAAKIKGLEEFILKRSEAYSGVLIDDLCTKGTDEPYRMLSSRAEWRLMLREDNVEERLFQKSLNYGLLKPKDLARVEKLLNEKIKLKTQLEKERVKPGVEINAKFANFGQTELKQASSLSEILKRPNLSLSQIDQLFPSLSIAYDPKVIRRAVLDLKYEGYLRQTQQQIERVNRLEEQPLPVDFDYYAIEGLSIETKEKLSRIQPRNLGQASRISGVTAASISLLAIYLSKQKLNVACVNE